MRDALVAFNVAFQTTLISGGTLDQALAAGKAAAEIILADAVTTIVDNIIVLASQGAHHFLVPNVANLGVVPAIVILGADTSLLATQLSFLFNAALEQALSNIELALPVNITRFDVFTLTSTISVAPGLFGLTNSTDACLTPEVNKGAICKKPDDYFFWDGIHPTRAGHALIADAILSALP